jgi:hypothetical protein
MSYLLAGGCSFTDDNYQSILVNHSTLYEKWPAILAKKLGIRRVKNTAISGGSNDMIFKSVIDCIAIEKPKAVFILMTGWDRVSVHNYSINYFSIVQTDYEDRHNIQSPSLPKDWLADREDITEFCNYTLENSASVQYIMDNTLRWLYLLQEICYREDIDLIVCQGLDPVGGYYFKSILEEKHLDLHDDNLFIIEKHPAAMINSPYFDKINHKLVIGGWPFFSHLGGWSFEKRLTFTDYIDPERDWHPNANGHKLFADIFYKLYKERYYS